MTWPFRFSPHTLFKYILLQIPGTLVVLILLLLAREWFSLPAWAFWTFLLIWVAKDVALFPMVWKAYDASPEGIPDHMEGVHGLVRDRLDPNGYIMVRGELWRAELEIGLEPLEPGSEVVVICRQGLTLLVRPESAGPMDDREGEKDPPRRSR